MDKKYKSLLNELCHALGILSPSYRCNSTGPAHSPSFVATLLLNGKEYKSSLCQNKKSAEEDVACKAYEDLSQFDRTSPSSQQEILPEEKSGVKLWRQTLYEWCQKTHRVPPTFNFVQSGPHHNPQFQATVEFTYDDILLKFQSTAQFKKKQAEEDVAEIAVKFLRNKITSKTSGESNTQNSNSNNSPITNINTNPINSPTTNTIPSPNTTQNPINDGKKKRDTLSLKEFEDKFKPPPPDLTYKPDEALINYCTKHFGKAPKLIKKPSSKGPWKFKIILLEHTIGEGKNEDKKLAVKEGFENCLNYINEMIDNNNRPKLPIPVWLTVFSYLDVTSLMKFGITSKDWLNIVYEHKVWENICKKRYSEMSPDDEMKERKWVKLFSLMATSELQEFWEEKLEEVWDGNDFTEVTTLRENNRFWMYIGHLKCQFTELSAVDTNTSLDPNGIFQQSVSQQNS